MSIKSPKPKPQSPRPNEVLITLTQIGATWGVSQRTVREWNLEPHSKEGNTNLFLLKDVVANRMAAMNKSPKNLTFEKTRKEKEHADRLEMANALTRGEQVLVADVEQALLATVSIFKSKMLGMKTRVGKMIARHAGNKVPMEVVRKIEKDLDDEVRKSLREIASTTIEGNTEGT